MADQIVQVGHVCIDAGKMFKHPENTHMVLIGVPNENKLLRAQRYLESESIIHTVFFEPDDDMGFTAIATRAVNSEERKLFSKYQIWRPNEQVKEPV